MEGDDRTKKLADLLQAIVQEPGLKEGLMKQRVFDAFDLIIGKDNAKSVLSHTLSRGTLTCAIGSSVLRSELLPSLEKIRKGINSALNEETVKKIVLR